MEICSVGDFLRVVKELYPDGGRVFFRGQSSSKFDVSSSLFRFISENKPKPAEDNYGYLLSNKLFFEFRNNIPIYSEINNLKNYNLNDLDIIMVAQHYGVPTRLIDWTKSPLVALYFSTEHGCDSENASVYMLRGENENGISVLSGQSLLNSIISEQRRYNDFYKYFERLASGKAGKKDEIILDLNEIANRHSSFCSPFPSIQIHPNFNCAYRFSLIVSRHFLEKNTKLNCAHLLMSLQKSYMNFIAHPNAIDLYGSKKYIIEPLPINPRIKNQQGVFLFSNSINHPVYEEKDFCEKNIISSHEIKDIKKIETNSDIVRIDIRKEYASNIHRELNLYGFSRDFIYPELPSFALEMQKRVVKDVNAIFPRSA